MTKNIETTTGRQDERKQLNKKKFKSLLRKSERERENFTMVVPWSWSIGHDDFVTAVWSVVCSFSLLAIIMSDVVRVLFVKLKASSKELKTNSITTIFFTQISGLVF